MFGRPGNSQGRFADGGPPCALMNRSKSLLAALLLTSACSFSNGSGGIGAVSCGFGGVGPSQPQIQLVVPGGNQSAATIQVGGVSSDDRAALRRNPPSNEEWQALLRITVVPDDELRRERRSSQPAVAGSYSATGDAIVFSPMFGFDPGRRYRAEFDRAKLPSMRSLDLPQGDLIDAAEVSLPKPELRPSTVVDRVYPTSEVVPENQLRLYIHFSAPMGLKGGLDYLELLDEAGV